MFLREIRDGVPNFGVQLSARLMYVEKLKGDLRKRFRLEYLGYLKAMRSARKSEDLNIGQVVYICDDNTKPIDYPLGFVLETVAGVDGNREAEDGPRSSVEANTKIVPAEK